MGFARHEYWSGLPFRSLGDLPNPGIEPGSRALQVNFLPSELPGSPDQSRVGSKSNMTYVFIKRRNLEADTHTGRMLCEDKGRDWKDASTRQRIQKFARESTQFVSVCISSPRKLKRKEKRSQ